MVYQIDQSGKIEQTNIDTIIALANGTHYTVMISRKDKRALEKVYKELGKQKSYAFIVFAGLIAILLKTPKLKSRVVIDREYTGHENTIHERILYFLRKLHTTPITIDFGHIGKSSKAHDIAAKVGSKKLKVNKVVQLEEILGLIFGIDAQKKTEVEND